MHVGVAASVLLLCIELSIASRENSGKWNLNSFVAQSHQSKFDEQKADRQSSKWTLVTTRTM